VSTTYVCVYVCVCWVGSWSHWELLQRCHSRHHRLTATQAWLHAYCLFTWTLHRSELAREFADNTVVSAKSDTKCCQFHFTELTDVIICWLRPCNGTHRRLPCSALSRWHHPVRSRYDAAVSWSLFSFLCCMYWFQMNCMKAFHVVCIEMGRFKLKNYIAVLYWQLLLLCSVNKSMDVAATGSNLSSTKQKCDVGEMCTQ